MNKLELEFDSFENDVYLILQKYIISKDDVNKIGKLFDNFREKINKKKEKNNK